MSDRLEVLATVGARRLGSGQTHLADVLPGMMREGAFLGAPCVWLPSPIRARCGATLHGQVVTMRRDQPITCRACRSNEPSTRHGEGS